MNRVHYNVSGLKNVQMKTQVENSLEKLDGVQMVNIDFARGSIEVGYNGFINENEIKQRIEHAGCRIE
jgi:copper chaperone CopZ